MQIAIGFNANGKIVKWKTQMILIRSLTGRKHLWVHCCVEVVEKIKENYEKRQKLQQSEIQINFFRLKFSISLNLVFP